jgi:hypothetical protein
LRLCSPVSPASFISVVIDFVANKGLAIQLLLFRLVSDHALRTSNLACSIVRAHPIPPYN